MDLTLSEMLRQFIELSTILRPVLIKINHGDGIYLRGF